jgi:hypothetical protein
VKKTFILFCFEVKQSEKMFILFCFEAKQKNRKQNEAKQKIFGSETKRKYAVLISLQSEAKRTEKIKLSRERAKRMQNESRFASFRFETIHFFCRNRRSLPRTSQSSTCSLKKMRQPSMRGGFYGDLETLARSQRFS